VQDLRFHDARTANKFTDEPVKAIDDLDKWAPTSMNDHPLRIVRVRSPATRDRLVQTMGGRQQGKDRRRSSGGHPGRGPRLPRRLPQGLPLRPRCTRHVRCRRRPARWTADVNTTARSPRFILAERAAGLAAGPMTGFDAAALNDGLFPDEEH